MRKIIFIILGIMALGVGIGYLYLYQGHRDIAGEESAFVLTSEILVSEFQIDADEANRKYLNNTVEVTGRVSDLSDSTILLEPGVFAVFAELPIEQKIGNEVKIKGRCIGFDELFGEVKLDQCTLK